MKTDNKIKHFTSSALIIRGNKILLVYHRKLDVWLYPGGHIEADENPDEALVREVKEETGLDIKIISDRNVTFSDKKMKVSCLHNPCVVLCELVGDHYHNDLVYLCKVTGGKLKLDHDEANEIGFFDAKEISSMKMFDNFRVLVNNVLGKVNL
jgi:ADP-ribose pyrophosphatase YjhB (NUDIX family)